MSSSSPRSAPSPSHLLRTHQAPVNALCFSDDNERLYSGDQSGTAIITSTRTLRPLASWRPHTDGILGIQEWNGMIFTHGRDNKLHVWRVPSEGTTKLREGAAPLGLPTPELQYSMDVNALNFCRFSLMPLRNEERTEDVQALIAIPNLVESSLADIWTFPSQKRIHAAIGKGGQTEMPSDGRGINSLGIIMSMHLLEHVHPNSSGDTQLRLLCAYENGSVTMWGYMRKGKPISIEGIGWDPLWTAKVHVESVMATAVSRDRTFALSASADHLIGRYDLVNTRSSEDSKTTCTVYRIKNPGNGAIAIRDDGRVCAIGGWDGKVRLYSTKSLKPLGSLDYHKKNAQSVAFARSFDGTLAASDSQDGNNSDDEMTEDEKEERSRWLAVGSMDNRVTIWPLISFEKT
ncbi:WD40-repeat-containing domain superfamily protein [Abortiporus biennis]